MQTIESLSQGVSENEENISAFSSSFLEDLGSKPKTTDELLQQVSGVEKIKKSEVYKEVTAENALESREAYNAFLKEKNKEDVHKGFVKAIKICAFGTVTTLFMIASLKFNMVSIGITLLVSALFLMKFKGNKALGTLVFLSDAAFSVYYITKIIKDIDGIYSYIALGCMSITIILSLMVCFMIFSSDNLTKYYESNTEIN